VTVDEDSVLKLYKGDSAVPVLQETVSNGRMATVAIEPRTGQLVLCGGINTKLYLFSINKVKVKTETAKLIMKKGEYSGH
jgi:hypothetical protein